jgi:hypothetical protein
MREVIEKFYRALEARDWESFGSLLAVDVRYELPQTRERIVGREDYLRFNREFPGDWHLAITRIHGDDHGGAAWLEALTDGEKSDNIAFLSIDEDGLVTHVIDFWPEGYEPPPGREHLAQRY